MKSIAGTFLLLIALSTSPAFTDMLINEVMSNEPGSDTGLEWVELWNFHHFPQDLTGWCLLDGDQSSDLSGVTVAARGYAVLARDAGRFEEHWGDSSGVWGDHDSENYPLIQVEISLRNSADTLRLYDSDSILISTCAWTTGNLDGLSLERIDPRVMDSLAVWGTCIDAAGSTPGGLNSISPRGNDLRLTGRFEIDPTNELVLASNVIVKNVGYNVNAENRLSLSADMDLDGDFESEEEFFSYDVPQMNPEDSVTFAIFEEFPRGKLTVKAALGLDDDLSDNDTVFAIRFGSLAGSVVINEILPDPDSPLESEWVEIYNVSDGDVDLDGWSLCDGVGCSQVDSIKLGAGEFAILCQDALEFRLYYHDVVAQVIELASWRSLNDDGDFIYLLDEYANRIDSVCYDRGYGGNVSIERIDPESDGFDLQNWYRSSAPTGSTPGAPNSVRGGFGSGLEASMESRYLSPDGDGRDDLLDINITLPRDCLLTLRVFDMQGRVVATIVSEAAISSGSVEFDGIGDDGNRLDIGLYVLLAEITGPVEDQRKIAFSVVGK